MILVSFGANLPSHYGSPETTISLALEQMKKYGIKVIKFSNLYLTISEPNNNHPKYVNAVADIETDLSPVKLLDQLLSIEKIYGRVRSYKNAPRSLDIDILSYNNLIRKDNPILPHPRLHERAFVLVPMKEVAPNWTHPESGLYINDLILKLGDLAGVSRF